MGHWGSEAAMKDMRPKPRVGRGRNAQLGRRERLGRRARLLAGLALLAAGAAMMALGLANGEAQQILRKAAVVCLECIGIG